MAMFVALLLTMGGAWAASPEAAYLAARDKAIAEIRALQDAKSSDAAIQVAEDKASAALVVQLKAIIGPVAIKGFGSLDTLNISLSHFEQGFGDLDGLSSYGSGGHSLVVTTRPLLRAWLEANAKGDDKKKRLPTDVDGMAGGEDFYNGSLFDDVNFAKYALLPVVKPARADLAVSVLGGVSQGFSAKLPNAVVATVIVGDRVLVGGVSDEKPIVGKIPACETIWARANAELVNVDDKTAKSYRACFNARASKEGFLAGAIKVAQSLVDSLAN
jgi:hypothetical protein